VEHALVDDHELGVVADQVVAGTGNGDSGREQAKFELAEKLVAAAMGVGDEGADADAAADRRFEGAGDFVPIVPEDGDVYGFPGLLDGVDHRGDTGIGLDDKFHTSEPASRPTPTLRASCWPVQVEPAQPQIIS
jgi:hypothetical protein